jgi:putative nucleotidyltransferase with HDIG domain
MAGSTAIRLREFSELNQNIFNAMRRVSGFKRPSLAGLTCYSTLPHFARFHEISCGIVELRRNIFNCSSRAAKSIGLERQALQPPSRMSIEAKDPYTDGHCDRLSESSEALAKRLSLGEEECIALRRGGVIHDIGKVAVPDQILLKPGPLTHEERKVMQQHTVVGAGICSPLKSFRSVLPIIRHHHEKMDGSGYPAGLKGDAIPLTARILQTVDIYDALTTDRPYRKALTPERAFALMREEVKKGWWDSALVDELEAMVQTSVLSK